MYEEFTPVTIFDGAKGTIHVVHEITFGDLIIATILSAMLIFLILKELIKRR